MSIKVYPLGEGPRATRNKRRTLENSDEWASLKAKMMDGIKPFEEVVITFTAQDKAKMRIKGPQRVFRDMAKEWIRKAGLPYSVDAFKSEGNDVVLVRNEPVLTNHVHTDKSGGNENNEVSNGPAITKGSGLGKPAPNE